MPYIKQERRMDVVLDTGAGADNAGELNYLFTMLAIEYCNRKNVSYQTINDILGALEGAKLEFYRKIAIGYEDAKIKENGDVYD